MQVGIGQTIAHYKITGDLGSGGMGDVYQATDTKLEREVAIKVLPEVFSKDKERLDRFDREAKSLAALNHPNIAGIYGIEEEGEVHALVIELVEGEDLSERLKRDPLPVEESLDVCLQIAQALEAAHGKGIIHRDLKPGNVKLTEDGHVKVLDFGLAKALKETDFSVTGEDVSQDPTITDHSTKPGTVLGTAAYMSPEQAKGRRVDKRSDIWSFGCVMYECLTGNRPFGGADKTETLASILKSEPDWAKLPKDTPATVRLLLRKCLAKDPKRRLHDVADARVDLEQAVSDPESLSMGLSEGALAETRGGGVPRAMVVGVAVVALVVGWFLKPARVRVPPLKPDLDILAEVIPPENVIIENAPEPAISPDGKWMAYLTENNRPTVLRELSTGHQQFVGRDYSSWPANDKPVTGIFFSKDSRYLCLCVAEGITRVEIGNGSNDLSRIPLSFGPSGADWVSRDTIVITSREIDSIFVRREGQEPRKLELKWSENPLGASSASFTGPDHVEGTQTIIATRLVKGTRKSDIVLINYETGESSVLIPNAMGGRYVPHGYLLFIQNANLYASRFDKNHGELVGEKGLIQSNTHFDAEYGRAAYAVSDLGMLVYRQTVSGETNATHFDWIYMDGTVKPAREPIAGKVGGLSISPDGDRMVVLTDDAGLKNVYVVGLRADRALPPASITSSPQDWVYGFTRWTANDYIYFAKPQNEQFAIVRTKVNSFKEPEIFLPFGEERLDVHSSTLEGELILSKQSIEKNWGIYGIAADPGADMRELFDSPRQDGDPSVSPDGKWIAFMSNWSSLGPTRIYARLMDDPDAAPVLVSRYTGEDWAVNPTWHPTENKLYYFLPPRPWTVMEVTFRIDGSKFEVVDEKELFRLQDPELEIGQIHPDGDRFLGRSEIEKIVQLNGSTESDNYLRIRTDLYGMLEEKLGSLPEK